MATLLEQYKTRISIAESVYAKGNLGGTMDNSRKLVLAKSLDNISKFMNESFTNSVGTQRSALGDYKKFALNITNITLPNLIAPELVMVHPMSSFSGYVTYMNFVAGSNKGDVAQKDLFNGTFGLGNMGEGRRNYTSNYVVEPVTFTSGTTKLAWAPAFTINAQGEKVYDIKFLDASGQELTAESVSVSDENVVTATISSGTVAKIAYVYDNIVIPQSDLPTYNATLESVALTAKARRIAIYYSQMAAFQAKNDYGMDLGEQLAEQASGELAYEIDSEIVNGLADAVPAERVVWSKFQKSGVSVAETYAGFAAAIELARATVYKRTGKYMPNYMVVAPDLLPILSMVTGWKAAPATTVSGPYFAGTVNGIKTFVSPALAAGKCFLGVNQGNVSAAVYGIYMPIVPTQLLGFADGAMSQGFSTLYDFKILAKDTNGKSPLLIGIEVTAEDKDVIVVE